jgi:predicted transcriptional regulator
MRFKSLKRHLKTHYDLSPEDYRQRWGLPGDYPMVAPSYSEERSRLAKQMKLGVKKTVVVEKAKAKRVRAA